MRTAKPTTILLEAWDAYGEHEASACSLCLLNRSCEVRDERWERLCRAFDGLRVLSTDGPRGNPNVGKAAGDETEEA